MLGAAAAAADADEVADDPVVGTINMLIEEGKLVNVVEDPRNAFMRAASSGGASATAKWMAGKMKKQKGANRRALAIDSSCQASDLTMCDHPGGGEVLKRYYQMNQAGKLPGPTAVGTGGLARSWTFAKPGDDTQYVLYGPSDYETHQSASKNPPDTSDAHPAISQATAYVKLHDNDFFAGQELTRLIRRGNSNASTKGNVAHISISPLLIDQPSAHEPLSIKTLKVKERFDSSDDESNLRLGLQLAWFKKPLDSTVSVDTVEVYEPSEVGYTKDEIDRD